MLKNILLLIVVSFIFLFTTNEAMAINTCDIIDIDYPTITNIINQDVKLFLTLDQGTYLVQLRTPSGSSRKTIVRNLKRGPLASTQISLGSFDTAGKWVIEISQQTSTENRLCNDEYTLTIIDPRVKSSPTVNKKPPISCKSAGYVQSVEFPTSTPTGQDIEVKVEFDSNQVDSNYEYYVAIIEGGSWINKSESKKIKIDPNNPIGTFFVPGLGKASQNYKINLQRSEWFLDTNMCLLGDMSIYPGQIELVDRCIINMPANVKNNDPFNIKVTTPSVSEIKYNFYIYSASDISSIPKGIIPAGGSLLNTSRAIYQTNIKPTEQTINYTQGCPTCRLDNGSYVAVVDVLQVSSSATHHFYCTNLPFQVSNNDTTESIDSQSMTPPAGPASIPGKRGMAALPAAAPGTAATCPGSPTGTGVSITSRTGTSTIGAGAGGCPCSIVIGTDTYLGVATAVGCVPTQPVGLIKGLLGLVLGIGGGIAFLLMVGGSFQMITSNGNPESLKAGQDRFTSAIIGILFLMFSILILQIIGFGILNIPGFS